MSQFDSSAQLNDLVKRTRASTPPGVLEQRAVRRMSIDEMNATDIDTLREKFQQSRRDDRGPVERFLDTLDAPRNLILSTMAPGLERRARERGETGAFGQGKVMFSDVLGEMGLKPGVVRGVLGFVGDLATDPLTYVGPAGFGLKVANKSGQSVRVGLRGKRALTTGLKEVAEGGIGAVSNPEARRLFEVAGKTATAADNAGMAAHLSDTVLGKVTQGKVGRALSRVGGDVERSEGLLAKIDQFGLPGIEGEQAQAARDFIAKYGKAAAPGIKLGKTPIAGSTIAHIPFTEFGIHVPAFTGEGKAAARELRIATATGRMAPVLALGPDAARVSDLTKGIEELHQSIFDGTHPDPELGLSEIADMRSRIEDTLKGHVINGVKSGITPAEPDNIGELLAMRRLVEEAESAAKSYEAKVAAGKSGLDVDAAQAAMEANMRFADAVRGSVKQYANAGDTEALDIAKRFLGIDDDVMGASVLTPMHTAARAANDPGIAADIINRVDRAGRSVFGNPTGALRDQQRMLRNTLSVGSRELQNATASEVSQKIVSALHDAGIDKPTADDYMAATQVAYANMFKTAQDADPEAARFFTKKFGTDEDADWVSLLSRAQATGMFSKEPNAQRLAQSLSGIAAEHSDALHTIGSQEFEDKVLGKLLEGYVPTVATPEAEFRIASIRNQQIKSAEGKAATRIEQQATEQFQKRRTTLQYRFLNNETGQERRFFEKDRWVQDISRDELEAIRLEDPASAKRIEDLREDIRFYDQRASYDKDWAAKYAPRNTDPWELNDLVKKGEFNLMLGGDPLETGFADTNIATVMASRYAAHERAVARKTWLDFAGQKGVTINPAELQGAKTGDIIVMKDGSAAKVYRDGKSGEWGVEYLGSKYRPLQKSVQSLKDNPIIQGIGDASAKVYHEDIARALEDSAKLYDDPHALLQALDKVTGAWKATTLSHPSWTVGNIVGDLINQTTNGMRLTDVVDKAKDVGYAIAHANNPEKLAGRTVTIRGQAIPAEQFIADLRSNRLMGSNQAAEMALQLIGRKYFVMPSTIQGGAARSMLGDFKLANLKTDFLQRLSHETAAAQTTAAGKARAAGFVARDRIMRRLIAPWFKMNERTNDYIKALAYASYLEQGNDVASAANRTIRAGFDYSDLSRIERSYFKRMFPFYSFMRMNGAYQLKLLLERPIFVGAYPLLQRAAEESINGDAQVPLHARPAWMRSQLALQVGSDPSERFAVMLESGLPQEQAFAAGTALLGPEGFQNFAHYFLTSVNPVIRVPAEIAAGREFFTDKTIGNGKDVGIGEYLSKQIRPIREIGKLGELAGEGSVGGVASRALLGGRVQSMTDDRIRVAKAREFQAEEDRLRKNIRTAEFKKDTARSVAGRAMLLRLYEDMVQQGYADQVPKWAQARLAEFAR